MKAIAAAGLAVVLGAAAGLWAWAPHRAMGELRSAAGAGDMDRVREYADLQRVSAGLRDRIRQRAPASTSTGELLASALVSVVVDRAMDDATSPQALRAVIDQGSILRRGESRPRAVWATEWLSASTVIAYPKDQADLSPQARDRFVFARDGLATWRLVEIRPSGG